jgi:hypothetical protein
MSFLDLWERVAEVVLKENEALVKEEVFRCERAEEAVFPKEEVGVEVEVIINARPVMMREETVLQREETSERDLLIETLVLMTTTRIREIRNMSEALVEVVVVVEALRITVC